MAATLRVEAVAGVLGMSIALLLMSMVSASAKDGLSACADPAGGQRVWVEVDPPSVQLDIGMAQSFTAAVWCMDANGTAIDMTSQSTIDWRLQDAIGTIAPNAGVSTIFNGSFNGSGPLFARAAAGGIVVEGASWIDVGIPPPPPIGCGVAGGSQGAPNVIGLMVIIDPSQAQLDIGGSLAFTAAVLRCLPDGTMVDVTATASVSWSLSAGIGSLSGASGATVMFSATANGTSNLDARASEGGETGFGSAWIAVGAGGPGWGCAIGGGGGSGGLPTPGPGTGGGGGDPPPPPPPPPPELYSLLIAVEPGEAYLQIGETLSFSATVYFCDPQGAIHDVTSNSSVSWTAPNALGTIDFDTGLMTSLTATANGSDLLGVQAVYGNQTGFGGAWISVGAVGGGWGCSWIGGEPGTGPGGAAVPPPGYGDPSAGTGGGGTPVGGGGGDPPPPWPGGYPGLAVFIDPPMAMLSIGGSQQFTATVYTCDPSGAFTEVTSSSSIEWSVFGSVGPISPTTGAVTTLTVSEEGCDLVIAQASYNGTIGMGASGVLIGDTGVCAMAGGAAPNAPGMLSGRVVDENGAAVPAAITEVLVGPQSSTFTDGGTDPDGGFRFVLPTGHSYRLRATTADGREAVSEPITLSGDKVVVLSLRARPGLSPFLYIGLGGLATLGLLAGLFFLGGEAVRLAILLVPFVALSRIKREKVLDHFVRGQIYGYIIKSPGTNYSEIKRELKLANGVLSYHIFTLEREGFVKSLREGSYRRYFPREAAVSERGQILSKLQKSILDSMRSAPGLSQSEIAARLGARKQKVSYNVRRLSSVGLVKVEGWGLRKRCFVIDAESTSAA